MSNSALHRRALLVVVSSPSGGGKTTLAERLLTERSDIRRSVSCTTRAPRGGERDGVHYHFLTEAAFDAQIAADAFLEYAVVHGYKYGTLRRSVEESLQQGRTILLVIDVQGGERVRRHAGAYLQERLVDIFVEPPSLAVLRERLEGRGEDAPDVIERRMANAEREMACRTAYRYRIVNADLDRAYGEFRAIIEKEEQVS